MTSFYKLVADPHSKELTIVQSDENELFNPNNQDHFKTLAEAVRFLQVMNQFRALNQKFLKAEL